MPGNASGFCIYNDVARRDPLAARPRRAEGGVRRHRRAPRRRGRADVLGRPARPHHLAARERADAVPRHRVSRRHRRPRRRGHRRQPRAAARAPATQAWLRAFHALVPALLRSFAPDVLVTQHGCDSHFLDPLAHLALSGRRPARRRTRRCTPWRTRSAAAGGWRSAAAATSSSTSCPRAWTHLTAIAAHRPIPLDTEVPEAWRAMVRERFGRPGPTHMGDGVAEGGRVWWRSWEVGLRPRGRRRPGGHGHPGGGLPRARPGHLVRLTRPAPAAARRPGQDPRSRAGPATSSTGSSSRHSSHYGCSTQDMVDAPRGSRRHAPATAIEGAPWQPSARSPRSGS